MRAMVLLCCGVLAGIATAQGSPEVSPPVHDRASMLRACASFDDPQAANAALKALQRELFSDMKEPERWQLLRPLLEHEDLRVRGRAAWLLGMTSVSQRTWLLWAEDAGLPFPGLDLSLFDESMAQAMVPALRVHGVNAIRLHSAGWRAAELRATTRDALVEAAMGLLLANADSAHSTLGEWQLVPLLTAAGAADRLLDDPRLSRIPERAAQLMANTEPRYFDRRLLVELVAKGDVVRAAEALYLLVAQDPSGPTESERAVVAARAMQVLEDCRTSPSSLVCEEPLWPRLPSADVRGQSGRGMRTAAERFVIGACWLGLPELAKELVPGLDELEFGQRRRAADWFRLECCAALAPCFDAREAELALRLLESRPKSATDDLRPLLALLGSRLVYSLPKSLEARFAAVWRDANWRVEPGGYEPLAQMQLELHPVPRGVMRNRARVIWADEVLGVVPFEAVELAPELIVRSMRLGNDRARWQVSNALTERRAPFLAGVRKGTFPREMIDRTVMPQDAEALADLADLRVPFDLPRFDLMGPRERSALMRLSSASDRALALAALSRLRELGLEQAFVERTLVERARSSSADGQVEVLEAAIACGCMPEGLCEIAERQRTTWSRAGGRLGEAILLHNGKIGFADLTDDGMGLMRTLTHARYAPSAEELARTVLYSQRPDALLFQALFSSCSAAALEILAHTASESVRRGSITTCMRVLSHGDRRLRLGVFDVLRRVDPEVDPRALAVLLEALEDAPEAAPTPR